VFAAPHPARGQRLRPGGLGLGQAKGRLACGKAGPLGLVINLKQNLTLGHHGVRRKFDALHQAAGFDCKVHPARRYRRANGLEARFPGDRLDRQGRYRHRRRHGPRHVLRDHPLAEILEPDDAPGDQTKKNHSDEEAFEHFLLLSVRIF